MRVKKYGLIHNSFLVSIAQKLESIPMDFQEGFSLVLDLGKKTEAFNFENLNAIIVSGDLLITSPLKNPKEDSMCFKQQEIKRYKIDCNKDNQVFVDDETKELFNLSTWKKNFTIS